VSRGGLGALGALLLIAAGGLALILTTEDRGLRGPDAAPARHERPVYRTAIFADLTARNPWSRYGPNTTVWNTYATAGIHPTLFGYTTRRFDWVPVLAADFPTRLELDPTVDLWRSTVTVKDGIRWSDGTAITAHDVAFTFRAIAALGASRLGGNFPSFAPEDLLERVEARSDRTVEFFLKRRDARFNFNILMAPIFSRAFWEPLVEAALPTEDPLRAIADVDVREEPVYGAFLYGTWERGSFVNRPANPRFVLAGAVEQLYADGAVRLTRQGLYDWVGYGEPAGEVELEVVTGPHVDAVHYRVYGNQATGVLALQAGQVDYLFNPVGLEKGFHDQLRGAPGIALVENPTNGLRYLSFNLRREPMSLLPFRQAVDVLIDREFITDRVLQGVATPVYAIVPPANAFWHDPDVSVLGRNLSRPERIRAAVRYLESAGFSWEEKPRLAADGALARPGRGLRLPGGRPVRPLELLGPGDAYDPLRATFALWIERWLNEVGIPVRPNLTAFNVVAERVFERQDFDMWILGWSLGIYPSYLHAFFHSRYTGLRGHNAQGYASPEYDRLVEAFLAETDDMERARTLAHGLQQFLARDLPYIVLFDTPIVEAYRSDRLRFPTTDVLGGLQNQAGFIQAVHVIE
jgi:peptide/nickel transport system substrate-binding protein